MACYIRSGPENILAVEWEAWGNSEDTVSTIGHFRTLLDHPRK